MELCHMVEKHRFLLLELNECYGTYLMRRDQVAEALDQLRSSERRFTQGESHSDSPVAAFKQVHITLWNILVSATSYCP